MGCQCTKDNGSNTDVDLRQVKDDQNPFAHQPTHQSQHNNNQKDIKKPDTRTRTQIFEDHLPMKYLSLQEWVHLVDKASGDEGSASISAQQILTGLRVLSNPAREKDLLGNDSIFFQILRDSFLLRLDKETPLLSKRALITWGLLYCSGTIDEKVRTFYTLVQEGNNERIACDDKDFGPVFNLLLDFSIKLVNTFEPRLQPQEQQPQLDAQFLLKFESVKDQLQEDFIDALFGANSILSREQYVGELVERAEFHWLFKAQTVALRVSSYVNK
ncbi:hypothetical protein FGO68_gene10248 [Halteria grandinella]|uniref:Uncharacterized protein n=1 Tax=Halteria grandinella TaxID=5974 RepID=A0A8J8SZL2_HALGN|nr:hypothetical protein FGO68_gene10248 [Halteria grandinella]